MLKVGGDHLNFCSSIKGPFTQPKKHFEKIHWFCLGTVIYTTGKTDKKHLCSPILVCWWVVHILLIYCTKNIYNRILSYFQWVKLINHFLKISFIILTKLSLCNVEPAGTTNKQLRILDNFLKDRKKKL